MAPRAASDTAPDHADAHGFLPLRDRDCQLSAAGARLAPGMLRRCRVGDKPEAALMGGLR